MKRNLGKRILSLALAAELFCTPLAVARAEDPAYAREETPLGEEVRPVQTTPDMGVELPELGTPMEGDAPVANQPVEEAAKVPSAPAELLASTTDGMPDTFYLGLSYGLPTNDYGFIHTNGWFQQESDDSSWGSRPHDGTNNSAVSAVGDDSYVYFALPDMGRVPDMELEGLYLYGGSGGMTGTVAPEWSYMASILNTWTYDESHPEDYRKLDYEVDPVGRAPADVGLTTTGTLVRVPVAQIKNADAGFVPNASVDYHPLGINYCLWLWCIPVVARWVPSAKSDMEMFALDITGIYDGVKKTTPVTELYTKPFREAAATDRLRTQPYSSGDYMIQDKTAVAGGSYTVDFTSRTEDVFYPDSGKDATQHYYLRVDEEVESITLRFQGQEPYYTYHVVDNSGSPNKPVSVSASFTATAAGGGAQVLELPANLEEQWGKDGESMFPPTLTYGPTTHQPQNSVSLPARSQWTVSNIPLTKVSEAFDANTDPFTTISVEITAPDGTTKSTYIFHIERLMTPEITLGPGNTPAAMIARDNSSQWNTEVDWGAFATTNVDPGEDLVAYNKASARRYFGENLTFAESPIKPNGTINQSGAIFMGAYSTLAWLGMPPLEGTNNSNPDLDPNAIVAYQDMAFDDPGVSFVDSEGRKVAFGDTGSGAYKTCVTRTIEMTKVVADPITGEEKMNADSYGTGQRCWYSVDAGGKPVLLTEEQVAWTPGPGQTAADGPADGIDPNKASQVLHRAAGTDPVDLRGLNVLPGIYSIRYTFTDPVSQDVISTNRRLVVLPIPGDVDMDGAVTSADALALETNAATTWSGSASVYRLIRNRAYNFQLVHGSQKITLDADLIRKGFQPILGDTEALGYSDYLYLPLPYASGSGDAYHARKTWDEVADISNGSGAKLRLDFLGIEQGTWNHATRTVGSGESQSEVRTGEVYTNRVSGPWDEATQTDDKGVSIVAGDPSNGTGDVFWMGVYLENPSGMTGYIKDLSISLIYDSDYVRPAEVYYASDCGKYNDALTRWQMTTLLRYNFLQTVPSGSNGAAEPGGSVAVEDGVAVPMTIFSGCTGNDYTYVNSVSDRSYITHYSKVEGDLERAYTDAYGRLNSSKLKEVVFSLQAKSTGSMASLTEGYLLVLPFKLIRHPDARMAAGTKKAEIIELAGGMRDFSIVLDPNSTSGGYSLFANEPDVTYAFSAQDEIFGGATQNIRQALTYDASRSLVPIGKDNTIRVTLKDSKNSDAVYDEPFAVSRNEFLGGTITAGAIPPGMSLDRVLGKISGTPTQAGTYDFSVLGNPFRIVVKPKDITYKAESYSTYYGETEFRNESQYRDTDSTGRDFTFVYDRADLSARDQAAAKEIFGDSWTTTDAITGGPLWGTEGELRQILLRSAEVADGVTYTAPRFQAQSNSKQPVGQRTTVGKYPIVLENQPGATNYTLTYDTEGSGALTIERRPVWVSHLSVPQALSGARIYNDETGEYLSLSVTEQTGGDTMVYLTFNSEVVITDGNGLKWINDIPITGTPRVSGDVFSLNYSGSYLQTDEDRQYVQDQINANMSQIAYRYLLTDNEETRSIEVESIATSFSASDDPNNAAGNYDLRSANIINAGLCDVTGVVIRRGVSAIAFTRYPAMLQRDEEGNQKVSAYYGSVIDAGALFVKVTRGTGEVGSKDVIVGEYVYNNPLLQPMELHYNWVSPEERADGLAHPDSIAGTGWDPTLPEGQQDLRPFSGTAILTPAIDGYYLCASVKKYETNTGSASDDHYIKVYSDNPISVAKKTITLTPMDLTRFYGEDNGALEYTYDIKDMLPLDEEALENWARDKAQAAGEVYDETVHLGAELEEFLTMVDPDGFEAPVMMTSRTSSVPAAGKDEVEAGTPVGGGEFYVILKGGKSTNYNFAYKRPRTDGNRGLETVAGPDAYGVSKLTVLRRPIQVSDVYSSAARGKDKFETIYSDTKNLYLTNQIAQAVDFALPEANYEAGTTSFFRHGGTGKVTMDLCYAKPAGGGEAVAVLAGDDVSVRYSVRFMVDDGHSRWLAFDNNYYDIPTLKAAGGTMEKDVAIADLELTGDDAVNYELVFDNADTAYAKAPANSRQEPHPDPNNNGRAYPYLIHGTGTVTLRKIESMTLRSVGRTTYTYGDTYAPYTDGANGEPMEIMVEYETKEDIRHNNGDYENNIHSEPVSFKVNSATDQITTFGQRGFTIYYLKPGQTTDEAVSLGQTLQYTDYLRPAEHNGARLFITGMRRAEDAVVTSIVSTSTLRVEKRELTLTTRDAHRYYGETLHVNDGDEIDDDYIGTTNFTYTFPISQLAQRDLDKLTELKGGATLSSDVGTEADLKLLQKASTVEGAQLLNGPVWDLGMTSDPTYSRDPGATQVNVSGEWSECPISISPSDLNNYTVKGEPGKLYVYPRPVRVSNVLTAEDDPVFTIYNQSNKDTFPTELTTDRVVIEKASTGNSPVRSQLCSDQISRQLPLSSTGLVGDDKLTFSVRLWFYNEPGSTWELGAGAADDVKPQVQVTFLSVLNAPNYYVTNVTPTGMSSGNNFVLNGLYGAVKLRTIDAIYITQAPKKLTYTYGEGLDLDGLEVCVAYKALSGQVDPEYFFYDGPASFQHRGLYVNYWYPEDTVPTGADARRDLPNDYRRAHTGDHLTIAPTHDTQQYIGVTSSDPMKRPFAANGKYLIISAFQAGDEQVPATPKILGAKTVNAPVKGGLACEGEPIAIQVLPRQLRYELEAQDKTYDGNTQAAGTLTLTNVFDAEGTQVRVQGPDIEVADSADDIHYDFITEDITDVVYIPMGAAYEDHGSNYKDAGYGDYFGKVRNGTVSFTTGAYQPNGEAPLAANGKTIWATGYTWGTGLTFTFANANVHYLEAGETKPRGIGDSDLAAYWRRSQDLDTVTDRWDHYRDVSAMPVEVTNMVIAGPDAANYTWSTTSGVAQNATSVTMTTRSQAESGQAAAPYAAIHKANRAAIQDMPGWDRSLPYLQLDEHTNVVRMFYDRQSLSAMADNNNAGTTRDEFNGELHFEYALYYTDDDGILTQWAGRDGSHAYQDTKFFGGELITPTPADGYLPDYDRLPQEDKTDPERIVYKGQLYRWAREDTGLSEKGYREDGGVKIDRNAYPGGAEGADAYTWYYSLYTWGAGGRRAALPRNTVFYPMVRLSETHNYNPSGVLTGDGNGDGAPDVTAQDLDAAQKAVAGLALPTAAATAEAKAASDVVFAAAQPMTSAAWALSRERVSYDAALAENGKYPDEGRPLIGSAAAVKTFQQRLDLISTEDVRSADRSDETDYRLYTLESVWFTDTLKYPDVKQMNAVVYNSPTRYYNYYWDEDRSALMKFNEEPGIDFGQEMTITLRKKTDAGTMDILWTYNPWATTPDHTAQVYVQVVRSGGNEVRTITIVPSALYARLGDAPYQLSVRTDPVVPSNRNYVWTTSDPSVATVSPTGLVTFRGVGSAIITVTAGKDRSDSIVVMVSELAPIEPETGGEPLFNFRFQGPWEYLDRDYAFRPKDQMTRGNLVMLLDKFLNPSDQWQATQELAYIDVTGREKYYEALRRLTAVGVVKGIPGSTFAGDRLATRAEFVAMLTRMLQLDVADTKGLAHAFADSGESDTWAYASIDALARVGVLRGVGDGNFAPNRIITREETAAILTRLLIVRLDLSQPGLLTPSDMTPENWSYESVVRSINTIVFPD